MGRGCCLKGLKKKQERLWFNEPRIPSYTVTGNPGHKLGLVVRTEEKETSAGIAKALDLVSQRLGGSPSGSVQAVFEGTTGCSSHMVS